MFDRGSEASTVFSHSHSSALEQGISYLGTRVMSLNGSTNTAVPSPISRKGMWDGTSEWAPVAADDRLDSLLEVQQRKQPSPKEHEVLPDTLMYRLPCPSRAKTAFQLLFRYLLLPLPFHLNIVTKNHATASLKAGTLHKSNCQISADYFVLSSICTT